MRNILNFFSQKTSTFSISFLLAATLALLTGCGSGVASSNLALAVLPASATVYYGNPTVFTITGGKKNYSVYSDNSAVISFASSTVADNTFIVNANNVAADTTVTLTVRDADGKTVQSVITVKPATMGSTSLKVTPDSTATGCAPAVCSGGTGLVEIQLLQFAGIANRSLRLDATQGDFEFVSGSSALNTNTLTVTTDQSGHAYAVIRAKTNAPTQFAILKATDLVNGSSQQTTFTIAQITDGSKVLTVIPGSNTIETTFPGGCSSGVETSYYIFGGTPPYSIFSTATQNAVVSPATVQQNGGGFTARTAGILCGKVSFIITDANGRVITATLDNVRNTTTAPPPPTPMALFTSAPASVTLRSGAPTDSLTYTIGGGSGAYYVSTSNSSVATVSLSGSTFTITAVAAGTATITVTDSAGTKITILVTVGTAGTPLLVSPSAATGATGDTLSFLISGGVPFVVPTDNPAPYKLTVNNPSIAVGCIGFTVNATTGACTTTATSPTTLTAKLLNVGTANFIVTDKAGTQTALPITVNAATIAFRLSPSSVTVPSNSVDTILYTITGGTPGFTAYSSDTSLATVSAVSLSAPYTFTLHGVSKAITANATVTITAVDSLGGTATASYIKTVPAP